MADKDDENDSEKTVLGAPLPTPTPGLSTARPAPVPPSDTQSEKTIIGGLQPPALHPLPETQSTRRNPVDDGEKTVIGGPVPLSSVPPIAPHPEQGQTIVGGGLPPNIPVAPTPPAAPTPPPMSAPARAPTPPRAPAPAARLSPAKPDATPGYEEVLRSRDALTLSNTSNPFVAIGATLLGLLGRLRTGAVRVPTPVLYDHMVQGVAAFERDLQAARVDTHDALVAKYALCGTIDDIVQNLPDMDRALWQKKPLVAQFFSKRDSNVGFFQEAQKASQAAAQRYNLLEFMLICLNLGFEGQYRGKPGGSADLASIRNAIFETLRRARPQQDNSLSPMWYPVVLKKRSRLGAIPIWAVGMMASLAVVAFFGTLLSVLNRDGTALAERLYALHAAQTPITLERAPGPVFVAPASQFERLSDGLAGDLSAARVELTQQGDFIVIRVANAGMFMSGSAEVNPDFVPLAARIAATLDAEEGPLLVLGFTDSRGAFNANLSLSVSRAEAVAALLAANLSDPLRVRVEGRGETEPIGDNSTEEGRAKNRRVEIKLAREGTF